MTRVRALLAAAIVAVLAVPAHAATQEATGWWWRTQSGLLVEVPPPPTASDGGLVVSAGPDGATAVAAVRFRLRANERATTLRLDVVGTIGTPSLRACPSAVLWQPAVAGRWDARPTLDCDRASATGAAGATGDSWTFDVADFATDRDVDVVIVPDVPEGDVRPAAFEVDFAAPAADALTVVVANPRGPDQPPEDPSPTSAPSDEPAGPVAPPPPGRFPAPPPAAPAPDPVPPVVDPPTPTSAPTEPDGEQPVPSANPPPPAADETDAPATAAAALLLASAGFLWSHRRGTTSDATERGLARWRTPRRGTPPPLI